MTLCYPDIPSMTKLHATLIIKPGRCLLPALLCMGLSGCDKAKELSETVKSKADEVSSKMSKTLENRLKEPAVESDLNALSRLVDHNEDGYVFRKDLDFPTELKVETVYKRKISGRIFHKSELGQKVEAVNGKETVSAGFNRKASTVIYDIKGSSFELPSTGEEDAKPEKAPNPFHMAPPLDKPVTFTRGSTGWKVKAGGDFKLMAFGQQLSPVFADLLVENAVLPRPLWFSANRVKIGDEIELSAAALGMVVSGKAEGKVKLKLKAIDEVNNHPCGVFSIKGEFTRSSFPNLEGRLIDQEVSIESGELWLSLIYPVILKEKLQTIQTFSPSSGGSTVGKGQGTIDTLVVREWQADIPLPPAGPPTQGPAAMPEPAPGEDVAPAQ